MKKVKSGKQVAEATRKVPVVVEPPASARAKAARSSAAPDAKSGKRASAPTKGRPSSKVAKRAAVGGRKAGSAKRVAKSGARQKAVAPKVAAPSFHIRELDPVRVCGDRTSVVQLYRVDEELGAVGRAAGARQVHLVFNDRHGWYCEHGRSCHAVSAVMRHAGIR